MRLAYYLFFWFFLAGIFGEKLYAQSDTLSIMRDLDYSFVSERTNTTRSLAFAKKALDASKKINYWKGISNAHRQIGLVYYNQGGFEKALKEFFQSMEIADKKN